jgi:hypothetical protein
MISLYLVSSIPMSIPSLPTLFSLEGKVHLSTTIDDFDIQAVLQGTVLLAMVGK